MNNYYADILALSPTSPIWWDENAVPRYCAFSPEEKADIYTDEVVLFHVRCQACRKGFHVVQSAKRQFICEKVDYWPLAGQIITKMLHYGDPPNVDCCSGGPTVNSEPNLVLQYWRRDWKSFSWIRMPEYEIDIMPDWV
jgi:hypothetical protein